MLSAVVIFVVTFLSETEAYDVCPDDWSSFQGSCYLVGQENLMFYYAEKECKSFHGRIVEITSEEENEYVKGLLNRTFANDGETKAYIGNWLRTGTYWYTISNHLELSFADWVIPVDYDTDEVCASMSKDENWSWVPVRCVSQLKHVCEKKAIPRPCNQGSCYQLLSGTFSISEMKYKCNELGGNVLEINSQGEQDFVKTFLSDNSIRPNRFGTIYVWLGASDDGSEGEFRWLSTKEKIDYTNWSDGEPNNNGANGVAENCVVLDKYRDKYGDFSWKDVVCDREHAVVCEI